MTRNHCTFAALCAALALVAAAGCSSMSQPFPEKALFAIDAGQPDGPVADGCPYALRVRTLRVAEPFDGRAFVYRLGPSQYKTDYYNGFVGSPDQLLTGEMIGYLAESRLFAAVIDSAGEGDHQYVLDGSVSELCGDYAKVGSPRAVVAARIFLFDDRQAITRVVFQKVYRKEAPLDGATPEALAAGLGVAYGQLLAELTADLSKARPWPSTRPASK